MNSGRIIGAFLLIAFMALAGAVAVAEQPQDGEQHNSNQTSSSRPQQESPQETLRRLSEKVSACVAERGGAGAGAGGVGSLASGALSGGVSSGRPRY
jgi:hypothetical protein